MHVGLDGNFHAEKRVHPAPAFEITNLAELMNRLKEYTIPFEVDYNIPGARRFYTDVFFGHRMEFLEWQDKPEAMMTAVEKASME